MKKNYVLVVFLIILSVFITFSCSKDEDEEAYVPVAPVVIVPPVSVDLSLVPYPKLSDYKFFIGDLKNQLPAEGVLPFAPASALFSDYAHKKRFVWLPAGTKATYNTDATVLELPVGAVLIKTFYYNNVQNVSPVGATRIVETRLMIRKSGGWEFANYVWNEAQTDAVYDMAGSNTPISFKDENNTVRDIVYRIPSQEQCIVCHKSSRFENGSMVVKYIPIGIKPQNLNTDYNYASGPQNQLSKWIADGYLEGNFTLPSVQNSTVNYSDASKSLEFRARSYVDVNCAHCHQEERHCDYRPMRFAYSETAGNEAHMGVCVPTQDMQGFSADLSRIVTPQDITKSMLFHRLNTTNEQFRMPLHGRTVIHDEGLALMRDWINSLRPCD